MIYLMEETKTKLVHDQSMNFIVLSSDVLSRQH